MSEGATEGHSAPPNHLGTNVPSGDLDEKKDYNAADPPKKQPGEEDDEEEEDMDALIEELESQDAAADMEEEETTQPGGAKPVPEDLLQTDTRTGLSNDEVLKRRKKFGLNQMKEEKENLILKFLGFFIGPIQFVMEVSWSPKFIATRSASSTLDLRPSANASFSHRLPLFSPQVSKIGSTLVSFARFCCLTPLSVSSKNFRPVPLSRS